MLKSVSLALSIAFVSIILGGCAKNGPAEIHYGEDQCDYCRMNIVDKAFGSEVVTSKGKVYKFDSIECLAAFVQTSFEEKLETGNLWLTAFNEPGSFVRLDSATIVLSQSQNSPMGVGLLAFGSKTEGDKFVNETGGQLLNWRETCLLVAERWKLSK